MHSGNSAVLPELKSSCHIPLGSFEEHTVPKNSMSCSEIGQFKDSVFDSTLLYQSLVFSKGDSNPSSRLLFMNLNLNSEMFC